MSGAIVLKTSRASPCASQIDSFPILQIKCPTERSGLGHIFCVAVFLRRIAESPVSLEASRVGRYWAVDISKRETMTDDLDIFSS